MENLTFYKKYYSLEDYLFNEVNSNFKKNHFLTKEEFFAIITWKSNRSKTKIAKEMERKEIIVEKLTTDLFNTKDSKKQVEILTSIKEIGIPIASAILSVCFSEKFTIFDYRVVEAINMVKKRKVIQYPIDKNKTQMYLDYVRVCSEIAKDNKISLREADKCLWGVSFYEGKDGLKELIQSIK